jgi:hypothetical protein
MSLGVAAFKGLVLTTKSRSGSHVVLLEDIVEVEWMKMMDCLYAMGKGSDRMFVFEIDQKNKREKYKVGFIYRN